MTAMKEISGNFIDLDPEEEEGRCASLSKGIRQAPRRYAKPGSRRRTLKGCRKGI
jgi:hypothetical protein